MTHEQFIAGYENWDSYKPLLWEGLELSTGIIIEMGAGKGSTKLIHEYAKQSEQEVFSYENDYEWWKTVSHLDNPKENRHVSWITNWDTVYSNHHFGEDIGLIFIDHAPGERRKVDIALFANKAQIIVAHDTEPAADYGYQMRAEIAKFKYWRDFETDGAWSSIMSNFIDVTKPL